MKNRRVGMLLSAVVTLLSCAPHPADIPAQRASLLRTAQGRDLLLGLVELDQAHPGSLALKVDLGTACLALGDLELARIYLEAGRRLVERRHPRTRDGRGLEGLLHAARAELAWRTGDLREAVACSERAIALAPGDPAGARLIRARALASLGETREALEQFTAAWETQRAGMLAEDYLAFARLLAWTGSERRAIEVIAGMQGRFPHRAGVAAEQSVLYARLGMREQSILAAWEELEYGLSEGRTDLQRALGGLAELDRQLRDSPGGEGRSLRLLAAGLSSHLRGDWAAAAATLARAAGAASLPVGTYAVLSARMESGQATAADIASYVALEARFRDLGRYYYHLWRGMKASAAGAGAPAVEVLEKCILLCPGTPACAETRRELGRALGLAPGDGEKLLLPVEVDEVARSVAAGGAPSLLEPVLGMLAVPANRYQARAEPVLRALARRPDVRAYLEHRRGAAGARLQERLAFLLEG